MSVGGRINRSSWVVSFIVIFTWQFLTEKGIIPSYLLPSPSRIFLIALDYLTGIGKLTSYSGTFFEQFFHSLMRVGGGFSLAAFAGVGLGYLSARLKWLRQIIDPLVQALRAVPGIGWLPVALVWFGVGETTTIFLISLAAFFPIYLNTFSGVDNVPDVFLRSAAMLGANKARVFTTVVFPAAFASVLIGLRLALGVSWAYLVLGELTGVAKGLGAVMMDARMLGNLDMVMVSMVLIALIGWCSDRILLAVVGFLGRVVRSDLLWQENQS